MLVGATLLKCPAFLELIEVGLLCDFITTKVQVSVSLIDLLTPPDLIAAHLVALPTCPAYCPLFLTMHNRGHKQLAYRLDPNVEISQ